MSGARTPTEDAGPDSRYLMGPTAVGWIKILVFTPVFFICGVWSLAIHDYTLGAILLIGAGSLTGLGLFFRRRRAVGR